MKPKVLVLGSDINTYSTARAYHELYNEKANVLGKEPMRFTNHSNIIDIEYDERLRDEKQFVKCLIDYAKRHKTNEKMLLIPTHDIYVKLMVNNRKKLEKYYAFNIPSKKIATNFLDKEKFYTVYKDMGLDFPETYIFNCKKETKVPENLTYPLIIKPSNAIEYNKHKFEGQAKVYKVQTEEEANEVVQKIIDSGYKKKLILQELVLGDDSTLFDCVFYCSKDKKPVMATFAQIGLQERAPSMVGNCTVLINGYNQFGQTEEVIEKLKKFLEEIGYQGWCEFDLKYDLKDNKFKVLEINPRQGRCAYYVTGTGNNLIEYLVDDLYLNKTKDFKIVTDELMLTMVPKRVIKKYIDNVEFRKKALKLMRKGNYVDPLSYRAEKSLKRKLYLFLRKINFILKYRKYTW